MIVCAGAGAMCELDANAAAATIIDTKGIIAPGMIDTHNHILFDIFDDDDWYRQHLYTNHNQWTAESRYVHAAAGLHGQAILRRRCRSYAS